MIPGLLVILSGIFIYYSYIKEESNAWSYFLRIIFFLTSTGLILYLFEIILGSLLVENFILNHLLTFLIISFAISFIIFIFIGLSKPVQKRESIIYSKVVVSLAFFGYVICIQGVKYFWGRVRFRELDATFSQFTPWYLPQGVTGFDSFPSGHAAMGWTLLPLLILFTNKKPWLKYSVFVIIFLWGVTLALSRVVIGAHYSSDVLFGSFFNIITYLLIYKHYTNQT
jgi:membrane-associated phospholipid phosphatase